MKISLTFFLLFFVIASFLFQACNNTECCPVKTETIVIYEDHEIAANTGISTGTYSNVDGYRFVNVVVEFSQDSAGQKPVSLGVIFAHDARGKWGARRYFNFEQNFTAPADPQMITLTGVNSWSGSPHNRSAYIARLPIMGPYMQVFPFNQHNAPRRISVALYLTE